MIPSVDVVCLSHLRWNFVFQRPNHLMSRCAKEHRVFYVEEPVHGNHNAHLRINQSDHGPVVVVPHLPADLPSTESQVQLRGLMESMVQEHDIQSCVLWCYTPMALPSVAMLRPLSIIYDCMDELSAFKGAPKALRDLEDTLFRFADLVFTGGHSLFEAKRTRHPNVHAFPSSVDHQHYEQARRHPTIPGDLASIPRPRIGYAGVIDERLDLPLLEALATAHPDWHFIMLGPVVKISQSSLPVHPNIHYLGQKDYKDLPAYLAHWDVAMMPFALNEATRFISPTKTLEYLAALKPVISTPIRDVVTPYGDLGLVRIARDATEFSRGIQDLLDGRTVPEAPRVDAFLSQTSWDHTWQRMRHLMHESLRARIKHAAHAVMYAAKESNHQPPAVTAG